MKVESVTEVDLVVQTLANIKELKAEEPKKTAEEALSAGAVLLFGEVGSSPTPINPPTVIESSNVQPVESQPVEELPVAASPEPVAEPKLEATEQNVPSPEGSASAIEVGQATIPFQYAPNEALKKAILDPDIYTDKTDRSRAIDLRWVLRDIRAKRTAWWPVGDRDLRVLIEMGLVEMREDVPVLTTLGLDAIE